ncbi:hypothetical protein V1264_007049 [Littorina saxatilis]|uniref:Uncharacterized protein n=1 Tax=Littorina saxatilis TaxID=31220 RepID=A0AAN9AU66_9CAEN
MSCLSKLLLVNCLSEDDVPEKSDVTLTSSDEALGCTPVTSSFVRMLEKNIPKGVLQKIIGNKGGDMDPRLLGRAMEDNPELGRQLRLAWEMHQQDKQDGFTKTTVLVTMKTDDIVRKAKALAEKQIHTPGDSEEEEKAAEEWDSSLYEENNSARASIAGDKFRTAYLRRKIKEVQRKREQTRADLLYRSAKPGQVPPSSERVQGKAAKKKPDKFYLDELQNKYQGLDPQEASKKVCSMGYQVLFVSRLRRRSRSMCEMRESEKQKLSASLRRTSVAMATPSAVTRFAMEDGEHSAGRCGSAETGASRRRSSGESQSRLAAGHTSIRKDAPVTLRALTMPSATSRVDG